MKPIAHRLALFIFLSILLTALACNLSLPGLPVTPTATPTATPLPLPPAIVETVPPVGSEIALQAPLTIYFSEPMERASVEAALKSSAVSKFLFNWLDDATLSVTPAQALPGDKEVSFTLGTGAKTARNGLTLPQEVTLSYRTAGLLRVAQVLPAPQADAVSPDSAVVASFNQPVVPLGADAASQPAGFTLEPAANGKGEWLNTSTYIFYPDPGLSGGIDYTVRVNPALKSTAGTPLDASAQNNAWAFRTSLPKVLDVSHGGGEKNLALDPKISVTFNQPMDRTSVESALTLRAPDGSAVPGKFEWNERGTLVTFTASGPLLARQTVYTFTVGGAARSKGGAALGSDIQYEYATYAPFAFISANIPAGDVRPVNEGLTLYFSAPIKVAKDTDLTSLLTLAPASPNFGATLDGSAINIYGRFDPGKTYTLTIPAALSDQWGQTLGQAVQFTFRESDARPALNYSSYAQELFTRPEDPVISVQAVNLKTLILSRGTLNLDDFLRLETDYNYRQGYVSPDSTSWTLHPDLPRNDNQPVSISLSDGPLTPGLYFINVDSPDIQSRVNPTQHALFSKASAALPPLGGSNTGSRVLLVSNINVTVKTSATETLIWAMDLRTQTPIQAATVRLYDQKGGRIASGETDANGLWRGTIPAGSTAQFAVVSEPGNDLFGVGATDWNLGINSYDFNLPSDTGGPHTAAYLYTDRPVYRPGDTVHFRGVLRSLYDGRYSDAGLNTITVHLNDVDGKAIADQQAQISSYGTLNGEFTLPAKAMPGGYNITLDQGDNNYFQGSSIYFDVADYRKPEINLSVDVTPSPVKSGDRLTGTVHAAYFFGAPVADLPFKWQLYSGNSYFSIPEYNTGIYSSGWLSLNDGRFGYTSQNGEGRTDANGTFSIPLEDIKVTDTTELTLEITATESGGNPVSARTTLTMHPDSFYIGIRPDVWVGQAGTSMNFNLLTVDWTQKPVGQPLTLNFEKVRWERTDTEYSYDFKPVYTPVESKSVTTGADGKASIAFTPPDAGTYMLEATSGNAKTQTLIWVGGGADAVWPNLPYDQVKLTANQTNYKPGDTASVFLPNPFNAPAWALFTTERGTFKSVQVVSVPADGYRLSLPITDAEAPNIYVSATLLGPGTGFRQGYVNLPVEPSAFTLNVDLKATPEKAKPGDTLTLDLTVTDSKNQPVQGEFSMAVVDLAALALAGPNSEDILPAYYDIQPLGVRTGLTDAIYIRRLLNFAGGRGGGGGGEVLTIREKFPDTLYWKTDIITDAQGKARITVTLPDSLTTWQVESRGLTKDTKVGQARVRVVTSKDLLIRPQTPRFLVVGDHAELAALVNNTTAQELDATVSLTVTGFSLDKDVQAEQKVKIPANGRVRVTWSGLVQDGEAVDAVFAVKSGALQDAARPTDGKIPVLRYTAPQTFSTAGILADANSTQTEIIAVPRTFQPLGGQLDLELSPSLASTILASLSAQTLSDTPWSTEEILSYVLPNAVTYQTLQNAGIQDAALKDRLEKNLESEVTRLLAAQKEDGGWPWAIGGDQSDPYLTGYIVFGLSQIQNSGVDIPSAHSASTDVPSPLASAIQRGRDYLFTSAEPLNGSVDLTIPAWTNQAAFYCYLLQETGGLGNLAHITDTLYDNRERLDPWAKTMLAQTLSSLSPTDERAKTLYSDVEATAIRSATGAHWESVQGGWISPGSPLYTTAVVVAGLVQRDPASPLAADAVRYLAAQRGPKGWWASSYENSWIILALDKYMVATGEFRADFAFSAGLNGAKIAQGQANGPQNLTTVTTTTPLTQMTLNGANQLTISRESGNGKLYYRAALTVDRPVETAPALNQGIAISRAFLQCTGKVPEAQQSGNVPEVQRSGKDCQPVTSYQMKPDESGRVTVRLTVTIPNDAYYFSVEDYIPAGSDILDSSLKTSQQGQTSESATAQFDESNPFGEGWGWWYFNRPQIFSDHILWSARYLPAGTYVLTYTIIPSLAGDYRVLPAHAWLTYFPEVQGTTAGAVFTIKP